MLINLNLSTLENMLWAGSFVAHLALLSVLLIKRCVRQFPVFTLRIVYQLIETIVLFSISRHSAGTAYARAYWLFAFGDYFLQISVIFEMARDVLRPTGSWIIDARHDFLIRSALGFVVALGLTFIITPQGLHGLDLWSVRSSIATSVLTCEVFLAMSLTAHSLSLQWRHHVMAIGEGLTAWAVLSLLQQVIHLATGWDARERLFDDFSSFIYFASVVFWTFSFARPEPKRGPLPIEMQEYLMTLHRQVLQDAEILKKRTDTKM